MVSALYARLARVRRARFDEPGRRRRLHRPVVSVGNLSVGGRGKTPTVAHVVGVLQAMGERPGVLSRGYKRRRPAEGVTVVHDGTAIRADLDRAGDEPLMLARALGTVPVLVGADRYLAGRLAELHLGVTVHVLDDGFQHLPLHRDIDLLLLARSDMDRPRTLPGGRLRESLSTAAMADAILWTDGAPDDEPAALARLGVADAFVLTRHALAPRRVDVFRASAPLEPGGRFLAVAGIRSPERFFADVEARGVDLVETMVFPDHAAFGAREVGRMVDRARALGASAIMTTEKDLVRLLPFRPFPIPVAWLPISVTIDPADRFRAWLAARLSRAKGQAS